MTALLEALMATALVVPGAHALAPAASISPEAIPAAQDPDHDGLPSAWEIRWSRTDPRKADTDGDGRKDGAEDPDHDGLANRREYRLHLDPRRADTDGDHIPDGREDPDHDGLSNRFEIHRTRTDPLDPDTDHDGIRDGAEDLDHDLLSNAGEELARTNPRRADTDRDGRDDWHEDADHDGVSNGMQQDRRPVPANLMPTLAKAARTYPPAVHDGCNSPKGKAVVKVCSYYGTDTSLSVFLVGDSHALQWQPALMDIAQRKGWRLYVSTKGSCPIPTVTVYRSDGSVAPDCDEWRLSVFAAIEGLHPDLVIAGNRNDYRILGADVIDSPDNQRAWHDGMVASLSRLKDAAGRVLLLGDTPHWSRDIPSCLAAHPRDMSACEDRRSDAISALRRSRDAVDAAARPWTVSPASRHRSAHACWKEKFW